MNRRTQPGGPVLPSRPVRDQRPERAVAVRGGPRVAGSAPRRRPTGEPEADSGSPPGRVLAAQPGAARKTLLSARSKRRVPLLAVLAVAVVAVAGAAAVAILGAGSGSGAPGHHPRASSSKPVSGSGKPGRAPTPTSVVAQAVSWLQQDLPSSAPVLTDEATAQRLLRAGRAAVQTDPAAWRSADYVLETPRLRASASSSSALRAALTREAPVAEFGTGSDQTVVARLLPDGEAGGVGADLSDRQTAGSQLLQNPRVQVSPAARAAFSSGAVDLRAATLLALMAQSGDVAVRAVPRVPAEDAAGLPVRRLVLSFGDPSAVADVLARLPAAYRPSSVTGSNTSCRLTWPVQVPPLTSVH